MITNDYDREQQEREQANRRLEEVRARMADEEHRARAARLAQVAADRQFWIDARQERDAAIAAAAALRERVRTMIGGTTIEAVHVALCDLMDRVTALEERVAAALSQEPRS